MNLSFSYDSDLNICFPNPVGVADVHTVGADDEFTTSCSP